jgi:hypothetical protein
MPQIIRAAWRVARVDVEQHDAVDAAQLQRGALHAVARALQHLVPHPVEILVHAARIIAPRSA